MIFRIALPVFVLVAILTAGWWVTPDQVAPIPLCGFKYLLGIDCPGCGLTRSFLSLARGNIGAAVHYNAAGPLIYLFLFLYLLNHLLKVFGRKEGIVYPLWISKTFAVVLALFLFGHWIVRLANGPAPKGFLSAIIQ